MRITTKVRYGVRFMLFLAKEHGKGPISMREIATREEISEKYLGLIALSLKNAGLVNSTKGSRGGYVLAKPPEGITLCDVMRALDGDIRLVDCVRDASACSRSVSCEARGVWDTVGNKIAETLDSITLEGLIRAGRGRRGPLEA